MKILSNDQTYALATLLGVKPLDLDDLVPDDGAEFIPAQWVFVGLLMTAAFKAGYGLRIEVECADSITKHKLWKWCIQAFDKDGCPTGAADEIRATNKDEKVAKFVALCLLDLCPKTGA